MSRRDDDLTLSNIQQQHTAHANKPCQPCQSHKKVHFTTQHIKIWSDTEVNNVSW